MLLHFWLNSVVYSFLVMLGKTTYNPGEFPWWNNSADGYLTSFCRGGVNYPLDHLEFHIPWIYDFVGIPSNNISYHASFILPLLFLSILCMRMGTLTSSGAWQPCGNVCITWHYNLEGHLKSWSYAVN